MTWADYTKSLELTLRQMGYEMCYSVRFHDREVAHVLCVLAENATHQWHLRILNLFVNKHLPFYEKRFSKSHMGTNLLSDVLMDVYFRQNVHFISVDGYLSSKDAKNNNWLTSIPFYRNFPKYMNRDFPYRLTFTLWNKDSNDAEAYQISEQLRPKEIIETYGKQDLYFSYTMSEK